MFLFTIFKSIFISIVFTWVLVIGFTWQLMFPMPFGEYIGPMAGREVGLAEAFKLGSSAWLFYFFVMGGIFSPILSALLCYLAKARNLIASDQLATLVSAFIPAFTWCLFLAFLKTLIGEW